MKLSLVFLAIAGLALAAGQVLEPTRQVKYADKSFLEKQKFLLEIVYRIENPLLFEEYIKVAHDFHFDKADYTQYDYPMELLLRAHKAGYLLPRGEFFGAMVKTHIYQAWGLFNHFYYAKDFDTFMRVASWARMHVSEGMFVYALHLAVIHRDDFEGLMLPAINEILPQHFFNSKLIIGAKKFDYESFNKLIMLNKEYRGYLDANNNSKLSTKDWKPWQWWKLLGLSEQWFKVETYILRKDAFFMNMIKDTHVFYMPTDYTRNLEYYNEDTKLSYFTEDVAWNAYAYYANIDYAYFLNSTKYGFAQERRGEYWAYNLHTMLARYQWERLAQGLGETPEFSGKDTYEQGYHPHLIGYNGINFGYRQNDFDYQRYTNYGQFSIFMSYYRRVAMELEQGYLTTNNGTLIDLRRPEAIEILANLLDGNADLFDSRFETFWRVFSHTYFADADIDAQHMLPHVFVNFETMYRDPFTYSYYKRFYQVISKFSSYLKPYTKAELLLPGVKIENVQISELFTYFDLTDYDVSTLLSDKMIFVDGQYVWDKTLLARQQRLNHKPFTFDYTIESDKPQKVVIRAFLGPKFDQSRRTLSLAENRENFIKIDEFIYQLTAGKNTIRRNSQELYWTVGDRPTYTDLYKSVMMAIEGKQQFALNATQPHCGFPNRLLLPQGLEKGFPMQFFFFVAPYTGAHQYFPSYDHTLYTCGIGSGKRYIDDLPLGYPFDRPIEEEDFFVPNMLMKNVKVYHKEGLEKFFNFQ